MFCAGWWLQKFYRLCIIKGSFVYGTFMTKITALYYFYQKFTKFIITHSLTVCEQHLKENDLAKQTFTPVTIILYDQFKQSFYCIGYTVFKELRNMRDYLAQFRLQIRKIFILLPRTPIFLPIMIILILLLCFGTLSYV